MAGDLQSAYEDVYRDQAPGTRELRLDRWPRNRLEACVYHAPGGRRVLDVGCGNGTILFNLRHRYAELCGIELAPSRVQAASEALAGHAHDIRVGNIEAGLPYPDGHFDLIVISDVIEHVVNLWPAMEEIQRLVPAGGKVILSTPNIAQWRARLLLVFGSFPSTSARNEGFDLRTENELHDGGHLHYFTFSMLDKLFARYGFSTVERFGIGRLGRIHNLWPSLLSGACHVVATRQSS